MNVNTALTFQQSMRSCINSAYTPLIFKALWIYLCTRITKRSCMESVNGTLETDYGTKLSGNPNDARLNNIIFYRGVFEPSLSDLLRQEVKEGDTCVDAGANTGYFSLLMAQQVGATGKVIAIEASPGNASRLRKNVQVNNFDSCTTVIEAACSDVKGDLTFYVHPKNDMHCRLELPKKGEFDYWSMGKDWNAVPVKADLLSSLVGEDAAKVSFLKLDVEGTEHKLCDDVLEYFTHPRLCVALEAKAPHIVTTLKPFEDAGFFAYDLQNDYQWLVQKKVKPAKKISFDALYKKKIMVDVLLSRHELDLDKMDRLLGK